MYMNMYHCVISDDMNIMIIILILFASCKHVHTLFIISLEPIKIKLELC